MSRNKEYRCLVTRRVDGLGVWVAIDSGWGRDRVSEPGNGKTYFDMGDLSPGDYNIIRMEWYDTWGSGQPRSYFVRVSEPPEPKMIAKEISLAEAEYGARK